MIKHTVKILEVEIDLSTLEEEQIKKLERKPTYFNRKIKTALYKVEGIELVVYHPSDLFISLDINKPEELNKILDQVKEVITDKLK